MTTLLAHEIEGATLVAPAGAPLGVLEHLLFHPSEPLVIGATVRPPNALVVLGRPETFLPLASLTLTAEGASTELKKLPSQRDAAKPLGYNPDLTVIWTGMPVAGPSGEPFGTISDIEFDSGTGDVLRLEVRGGMVADAAHGRYVVPGRSVVGYEAGAVHLTMESGQLEATGGLAKGAAAVAIVAGEQVAKVGQAVEDTVVAASGAAGAAIKVVADTQVVQKTAKRVSSTWRNTIDAFKEGMRED